MTTDTIVEDARWPGHLPELAARAARAALWAAGLDADDHEVCVLATSDEAVADLNRRFRGKPSPTNVLSFPSSEVAPGETPAEMIGDVALAYETCAAEAAAQGKSLDDHATHLIVHAVLHCLGHDHAEEGQAALMEGLETTILEGLGIADPYSDPDRPGKDP